MESLRARMPFEMPLTMTALASWCVGDRWLNEIPVHEAVPMVFEMGRDGERIRSFLAEGSDWNEPLCTASYCLSVDERPVEGLRTGLRFYFFNDAPWSPADFGGLELDGYAAAAFSNCAFRLSVYGAWATPISVMIAV